MKIGVIGAGTMGSGIAQAFAQTDGYEVNLCDIKAEWAEDGKAKIAKGLTRELRRARWSRPMRMQSWRRSPLVRTKSCRLRSGCRGCAGKDGAEEGDVQAVGRLCKKDCIFASNTSSLSITEISNGLDRAVVGMHFFNPAPVMKLVEVIAGETTSPETVQKVIEVTESIGKTPVQVNEAAGFVVNRILIPMINEAIGIYADGVASVEGIDTAMKLGANHPMGPLALGDLIGLDVCLAIMEVLQSETGDPKYRPHPLLSKMVRAGKLGRRPARASTITPNKKRFGVNFDLEEQVWISY